jgi:hypothetical protein
MREINDSNAAPAARDGLIARAEKALSGYSAPLTEERLWSAIAGSYSDEWLKASLALKQAKLTKPLGKLGRALESDEERMKRLDAQAWFTIVDEELRQDTQLREAFTALASRYNIIERALQLSHDIAADTEDLSSLFGRAGGRRADIKRRVSTHELSN